MRCTLVLLLLSLAWSDSVKAQVLTLPPDQRPEWLRRDGIVMAGSWEPLFFRVRRDSDSAPRYTPTRAEELAYEAEHGEEMITRLTEQGVNFVMIHCHKGAGMAAEQQSMDDAVRFARLCHDAGLHVGTYVDSGTLFHEFLLKEKPGAKHWIVRNDEGNPVPYINSSYRHFHDRCHPEVQNHLREITRFAIEKVQTDLLHFDNYIIGPGSDVNSVDRFNRYLQETFDPQTLRRHGIDPLTAQRPKGGEAGLLRRAWQEFCCRSLADSYHDLSAYARTLRPDVLVECNPGGVLPSVKPPVDHLRLYTGGDAVFDESGPIGFKNGRLRSRIRTCKIARSLGNMVFTYTATPLDAAEAMAFNFDCLGIICKFEYARLTALPGRPEPPSPELARYVQFFQQRRELLRDANVVADVAILRSFPSQVFGEPAAAAMTGAVEDELILNRICFQILGEQHFDRFRNYRGLVLAGCAALSDSTIQHIRHYVARGGRLCVVGPLATHDEWMRPRPDSALKDLPSDQVRQFQTHDDWVAASNWAAGGQGSLTLDPGPGDRAPGLCMELTDQPGRRLVHLVNYGSRPVEHIRVRLTIPGGKTIQKVTLASPEHDDFPVPFTLEANAVCFDVPVVRVYDIAVVEMQ